MAAPVSLAGLRRLAAELDGSLQFVWVLLFWSRQNRRRAPDTMACLSACSCGGLQCHWHFHGQAQPCDGRRSSAVPRWQGELTCLIQEACSGEKPSCSRFVCMAQAPRLDGGCRFVLGMRALQLAQSDPPPCWHRCLNTAACRLVHNQTVPALWPRPFGVCSGRCASRSFHHSSCTTSQRTLATSWAGAAPAMRSTSWHPM